MAVIALCSASGSPGVTTTAVGLALLWPRPVLLVEADPTGGSGLLAGYFRGAKEYGVGLLELALSPLDVAETLPQAVQPIEGSHASYVAGTRSHAQAAGLRDLWPPLAAALSDLDEQGQDVIVDGGRLGLAGSPEVILAAADLTVLMTRSTLPALAAARSRAASIRRDHLWHDPAVLLVGEGQPYRSHEVAKVLGLPVIADVADDPESAAVFSRGATPGKTFPSGVLTRSLHATIASLQAQIARGRFALLARATP
ncbi:hypothetical protein FB382_001518 [Nocardioides ginsengisegetis]|uniref:MinD-like ATPase involved in chromosome partitioning or flagellar assembly n=1 Tax=Nocardioides ginsengisegetis TaxID=661491 RepID=A0A7W3IYY8_9ACTN|nr:hypothetical protein [Nocardioides ginsengisegetis]MBA8803227.1 hypothetical protein [Nocardioides ginsengisegetis]